MNGQLNSIITPPLESDHHQNLLQLSNLDNNLSTIISELPDSPESLNSCKTSTIKYRSSLLDSLNSINKLNNIATHSHLNNNNSHRFHPFYHQNGTIGGSSSISLNQNTNNNDSQSSNLDSIEQQMPETDCYFPTTNMLDYHLNSAAYIGELSPTKCNDYQVNGYTSNYYSRYVILLNYIVIDQSLLFSISLHSMQSYPLNHHSNTAGQHNNSTLNSIPNAASAAAAAASFYNPYAAASTYGMLSHGYMTGVYY